MLVPTVKSPHGRHRARVVICGNHLFRPDGDKAVDPLTAQQSNAPFSLYAGGADGTALRTLLRKSALESWSVASLDVKTAFLLAPRRDSQQRLLLTRPPKVFIEAKVCKPNEIWEVKNSLYGLQEAPLNWSIFRDEEMSKFRWSCQGADWRLMRTTEPNLWKVVLDRPEQANREDKAYAYVAVYVDDILVTGEHAIAESVIQRFQQQWTCSTPEWLTEEESASLRFCGFELSRQGPDLLLHQQSYLGDLLARYSDVKPANCPLPGVLDDSEESNIEISAVRRAQTVVGELLWLAVRTRLDISYAVAWLGRHVARCPNRVMHYGRQVLGFLSSTQRLGLLYTSRASLESGSTLEHVHGINVFSDASFGPPGSRGHQGLVAMYAGCPVQWESKQQAFGTLSSSESELLAYTDALTMGESCAAVAGILENGDMDSVGGCTLHGDSQSGLRLLHAPDGAWRTRHLRLRSFVLRERIRTGCWRTNHIPGAQLAVDLLTKPIASATAWDRFRAFAGLRMRSEKRDEGVDHRSKVAKLAAIVASLAGLAAWTPVGDTVQFARSLGIAALSAGVAWVARSCCDDLKRKTNGQKRVSETCKTHQEHKRKKNQDGVRENEPTLNSTHDLSPTGSPVAGARVQCDGGFRMAALRMSSASGGAGAGDAPWCDFGEGPWMSLRFREWPRGKDKWEDLGSGWWVRTLSAPRVNTYHPVHRSTPFNVMDLLPERHTLWWPSDGAPRMLHDEWSTGQRSVMVPTGQWRGYAFFRMRPTGTDTPAGPAAVESSSVPRLDEGRGEFFALADHAGYQRRLQGARARGEAALAGGVLTSAFVDPSLNRVREPSEAGEKRLNLDVRNEEDSDGSFSKVETP